MSTLYRAASRPRDGSILGQVTIASPDREKYLHRIPEINSSSLKMRHRVTQGGNYTVAIAEPFAKPRVRNAMNRSNVA